MKKKCASSWLFTKIFLVSLFLSSTCFGRLCARRQFYSTLHTRQSSIQNNKYQVSHRYSCFSWWWAHSRPKRVEKRNKHSKKYCAPSCLYLQDYTATHGQRNKNPIISECCYVDLASLYNLVNKTNLVHYWHVYVLVLTFSYDLGSLASRTALFVTSHRNHWPSCVT
jgi:hypothetical protein